MLDDIKADETSNVEPWIENIEEETGCLEPAFKQSTNERTVLISRVHA